MITICLLANKGNDRFLFSGDPLFTDCPEDDGKGQTHPGQTQESSECEEEERGGRQ